MELPEIAHALEELAKGLRRHLQRSLIHPDTGSQNQEKAILRALLPDDPICYVDVGAAGPIDCSLTWDFYCAGGRGLLIEPLEEHRYGLLKNRAGDFLWPAAVADYTGAGQLRIFGGASTLDADWRLPDGVPTRVVEVDTLANVLDRFPTIRDARVHLCTIDVEGTEREVLLGIDWDRFHPDVFCIEHAVYEQHFDSPESLYDRWAELVLARGYRLCAKTRLNAIFCREDVWSHWETVRPKLGI